MNKFASVKERSGFESEMNTLKADHFIELMTAQTRNEGDKFAVEVM